jgi:hypothetical protein
MSISRVEGYRQDIPYGICDAANEKMVVDYIFRIGYIYRKTIPPLIQLDGRVMWLEHMTYMNFTVNKERPTSIEIYNLGDVCHVYAHPYSIITDLHNANVIRAATPEPKPLPTGQLSLW